jgi:cytochrome bd-I ubiquinol oxidase subunit X
MWYFSWILGIGVALGFGIINVMWLDANGKFLNGHGPGQAGPDTPRSDHADTQPAQPLQPGEARRP